MWHTMNDVVLAGERMSMGIARIAGLVRRAGARVTIVGPECSILRSRFASASVPVPRDADAVIDAVRDRVGSMTEPRVIWCDEELLRRVVQRRGEPWLEPHLPWAGDVDGSRSGWAERFAASGVHQPSFVVVQSAEDAVARCRGVGYPLVLKADGSSGGHGVRRIDSDDALRAALGEAGVRRVAQAWVDGVVGTCEMLLARGRVLAWWPSRMLDPWPEPYGPSTRREAGSFPGLERLVEAIAAATAFDGLCGFDWICGDDGRYRVIEFHPRPQVGYHLATLCGVDFPEAIRAWLARRAVRVGPGRCDGSRLHVFPAALKRAAARGCWIDAVAAIVPGRRAAAPWSDPLVLLRQGGQAIRKGLRDRRRKSR